MASTLQNEYRQKIEMNLETEYILYYLGWMERFQAYHLTGAIKDAVEDESKEWQGFVTKIKYNQRNETAKIKSEIEKNNNKMEAMMGQMEA